MGAGSRPAQQGQRTAIIGAGNGERVRPVANDRLDVVLVASRNCCRGRSPAHRADSANGSRDRLISRPVPLHPWRHAARRDQWFRHRCAHSSVAGLNLFVDARHILDAGTRRLSRTPNEDDPPPPRGTRSGRRGGSRRRRPSAVRPAAAGADDPVTRRVSPGSRPEVGSSEK
jgi:hypothetical protein